MTVCLPRLAQDENADLRRQVGESRAQQLERALAAAREQLEDVRRVNAGGWSVCEMVGTRSAAEGRLGKARPLCLRDFLLGPPLHVMPCSCLCCLTQTFHSPLRPSSSSVAASRCSAHVAELEQHAFNLDQQAEAFAEQALLSKRGHGPRNVPAARH